MEIDTRDSEAVAEIATMPTILKIVSRVTQMRFVAVVRITGDRWIACSILDETDCDTMPKGALDLRGTICEEVRDSGRAIIIEDVGTSKYSNHPAPARFGFRSYIAVPIHLPDGSFFGNLCALDPDPRRICADDMAMFQLFADGLATQIEHLNRLSEAEGALLHREQEGELREQFIAVLGHDLRNPLASVQAGIGLLKRDQPDGRARTILAGMQSSVDRMAGLIDDILDLARGRLGGGIALRRQPVKLDELIDQVVDELLNSHPGREIIRRYSTGASFDCDPARLAQLLSNLVGNALTHGATGRPVEIVCKSDGSHLQISVENGGEPLAPATVARLFHPFSRGKDRRDGKGLGLGLYIASQIAKAHDGELQASSDSDTTRFTFTAPLAATDMRDARI